MTKSDTVRPGTGATSRAKGEVDSLCSRFESDCRGRGVRVTAQRLAVYRAVVEDLSHPTAEAVHRRILPQMGSMSVATVYRILDFLVSAGLLRRVSTTESVCRFDANIAAHQHLICRACGGIRDFEEPSLSRVALPRRDLPGFLPESLDIRIIGVCESCSRKGGKSQAVKPTARSRSAREDKDKQSLGG